MDSDQEVVREPFEDSRSNESPCDNREACSVIDFHLIGTNYDDTTEATERQMNNEAQDSRTQTYQQDDSSSEDIEDTKFADSFGIKLRKRSKVEMAYDRLLNSNHTNSSTKPKPAIKTSLTSDCIYHKGTFYQKGDIVALCDQDDGLLYFAQLTGFLQDQYCEKSASLNWLVPVRATSREFFDPSAYEIGLEDTHLRKLDCMTFVRHCPHDYYLRKFFQLDNGNQADQSLKPRRSNKEQNYIWTTMKPCRVPSIETE